MDTSAYMIIRQYAVDLVMNSPEREIKILSERDLCKTFNVSRPTVRKALKDLIDDEYLIIRKGLGTYTNPCKALYETTASLNAISVGIIIGDGKNVSYYTFFGEMITGCLKNITLKGGFFRLVNIMHKGQKAVENIQFLNVNGVVWINPPKRLLDIIDGLEESGIPVAVINRFPDCKSLIYTGIDYEYEGYITAKHFLENGHKQVMIVIDPGLQADCDRLKGFKNAFSDSGVDFNDDFLFRIKQQSVDSLLQALIKSRIDDITGFYVMRIEALKALETFIALKEKAGKTYLITALEYMMRLNPEIRCTKIIEPLAEAGALAVEKLSETIQQNVTEKTVVKLKPKLLTG